jgi:hypothetical protein
VKSPSGKVSFAHTLIICLFLFIPAVVHSGHIAGAEISYLYSGSNQYLVQVRIYRDCFGIAAPPALNVCFGIRRLFIFALSNQTLKNE